MLRGGADDEADAGLAESGKRAIEVDGNADGDAGCQAQYPVISLLQLSQSVSGSGDHLCLGGA
jgi:hypothetical protein